MVARPSCPALRPVETIVVPDARHGKVLVLRDTQGIAEGHAVIPPPLIPIIARFTGTRTIEQIAKDASKELGVEVPVATVASLVKQLDEACFLDSDTFARRLDDVKKEFAALPVREASHAGGAYPGKKKELDKYIATECVGRADPPKKNGAMVALVAPHIDPWRGAVCYGHAYGALAGALPEEVDTFVLLGTSHAPMREPFALCKKAYDTPFGTLEVAGDLVDDLEKAASFDPYFDQLNHKREHSIEFQAVFLKHLLGKRSARAIPILTGLGEHQSHKKDPWNDIAVRKFLDALREIVAKKNVLVIAGADLAHVGPRFGDATPFDAEARSGLHTKDTTSLERATERDPRAFWDDVVADIDERRICGLAPIYSMLDVIAPKGTSRVLHYEQTIDPDDGSIVSHAAVGFYAD